MSADPFCKSSALAAAPAFILIEDERCPGIAGKMGRAQATNQYFIAKTQLFVLLIFEICLAIKFFVRFR